MKKLMDKIDTVLPNVPPEEDKYLSAESKAISVKGEADLAEYCRRKGLFVEQIAAWRQACQQANAHAVEHTQEQREQGKADRKRIKQLEKELLRKDKALAEAAALIILRKKAQDGLPSKRHHEASLPEP